MSAPNTIPAVIDRVEAARLHSLALGQLSQTVLNWNKLRTRHPSCGIIKFLVAQAQEFATSFGWSYSDHYKCLANLLCSIFGETYAQLRTRLYNELAEMHYRNDKTHELLLGLFRAL